jgi:SAM-dependent methyltransferase
LFGAINVRWRLFLLSFLMLFLELALIRWLGENILYLSFFTNFVLLASFLGIGVGFLLVDSRHDLFRWLPYSLLALVALVILVPVRIDRTAEEVLFLGTGDLGGFPIWVALPLVFLTVTALLAMVGQETGRAFAAFKPLTAYRLDILGSLAGVLAFAGLSLVGVPPIGWGIGIGILLILVGRSMLEPKHWIAVVGIIIILGSQNFRPDSTWSPYYRIDVVGAEGLSLNVNGIPHQTMESVEDQEKPIEFFEEELGWLTTWPYRVLSDDTPESVLVIGAGSGNDIAYALSRGASHVDGVEIDPGIRDIGIRLHPNAPYSDARVKSVITDGREFMENTESRYDLVIFALPDSLTIVSGQSSLRLESYLYTVEAFEAARRVLADNGAFAIYNTHPDNFVVERMANTMSQVFGSQVCGVATEDGRPGAALIVGPGTTDGCEGGELADVAGAPVPVTDDRPFVYVQDKGLPTLYAVVLLAILVLSFGIVRGVGVAVGRIRPYADLFLMGAAFLLLETKSIVQFALLFGTTWSVNVLVFAAVLVSVLAAIEVANRFQFNVRLLYVLLFASLALAWAIPPSLLLSLAAGPRWLAASLLTFLPVFIANLVFAVRFKETASSTTAFGANLLGAMVGGVLEYSALLIGYRALVIVAGVLYAGAFLALRATTPRSDVDVASASVRVSN